MSEDILKDIICDFDTEKFIRFFRGKNRSFAPRKELLPQYNDDRFIDGNKLGEIKFTLGEKLIVCALKAYDLLSERSGKKVQYEKGKRILKDFQSDAGIFIFYDQTGNFRFSLVYPEFIGRKRSWSNFRRFTYYVSKEFTNKTFLQRIGICSFSSLENVKEAFSLSAITDIFYEDFFVVYNKLVDTLKKHHKLLTGETAPDVILLFVIRIIFLGFIQKKGWIGGSDKFIQNLLKEYEEGYKGKDLFYQRWLCPLFFKALNSPPGGKVAHNDNDYSDETAKNMQMAPYLNGGLFKKKSGYDDQGYNVPDKEVKDFFAFLFSHNFTIEENSYEDEELQLNPEFLGIIFERLVNKANGAVYTPRIEVDFMCRLSLVKWLEKNISLPISKTNLYELFFREGEKEEDQKHGSFSEREIKEMLDLLENITVCDPAAGSGAFLIGMMQVLDEIEQSLRERSSIHQDHPFERKKRIIAKSLYGVEIKEWAVWICQLRLWLALFIESPDELKSSLTPILPSLDFKVRHGDSLVQRIGNKAFPVLRHADIPLSIKTKVTQLKNLKSEYFHNKITRHRQIKRCELTLFREILNAEMSKLKNKKDKIKKIGQVKQTTFFGEAKKEEQQKINYDKKKIKDIEKEISEHREELKALRGKNPFTWNIEFSEIFSEKEGFDIVIGNPPYIRQENIVDPSGKIEDAKEYKKNLKEMVKIDFPIAFKGKEGISSKSDMSTYFYIRGLRLLNNSGIHAFICSNSWLDVGYGVRLQKFLVKHCPIHFIIDNHAERSFKAAAICTIISIISSFQEKITENHLTKFIAFKKPFESVIYTENLTKIENTKSIISSKDYRVYPIANKDQWENGLDVKNVRLDGINNPNYIGDKWGGKYLRAPDIFFTLLEKGKNKLIQLSDIANIRRGITSGANDFFYLTKEQLNKWKIEKEYLKGIIVSPRENRSRYLREKELSQFVFLCDKTKKELKGTNALKYIEWGESKKIKIKAGSKKGNEIKGFNSLETMRQRGKWWNLGVRSFGKLLWPMSHNDRLAIFVNNIGVAVDHNLFEITPVEENDNLIPLFSTISFLFREIMGRANLGEGALKTEGIDVKRLMIVNPEIVDFKDFDFNDYCNKEIRSIFDECGIDPKSKTPISKQTPKQQPIQKNLDDRIFEILGFTDKEKNELFRSTCQMVWNRINKAKK